MPYRIEGKHRGEYLVAEGNGDISRETITLAQNANVYSACTVLGLVTATGKYVALAPTAADGSQNAAGILYDNVDATAGDKRAVITARETTVNASDLVWGAATAPQIAAAKVQLAALEIICRNAI